MLRHGNYLGKEVRKSCATLAAFRVIDKPLIFLFLICFQIRLELTYLFQESDISMPPFKRRKLSNDVSEPTQAKSQPLKKQIRKINSTEQNGPRQSAGRDDTLDLSSDPPSDRDEGFREDDEASSDQGSEGEDSLQGSDHEVDSVDESEDGTRTQENELRSISFGALAEAQDSLPNATRRKGAIQTNGIDGKSRRESLKTLRHQLSELPNATISKSKHSEKIQRGSKHAPTEQSSKRQVSRRREVIDTSQLCGANAKGQKLQGDPRFSAATGSVDHNKIRKNYAFLHEYAQKELQELRDTLREGKKRKRWKMSEDEQAEVKKEIMRRENRMKAEAQKEKEREVAQKHKKEEREKIKKGKKPFYLKKNKMKEEAKNQTWEGMKSKDKQKAEQRKRRRQEQKEMKRKPGERRAQ